MIVGGKKVVTDADEAAIRTEAKSVNFIQLYSFDYLFVKFNILAIVLTTSLFTCPPTWNNP